MSEGIGVTSQRLFKENASRVSQETKAKRPVLLIYQHCGLPLHFTNNNRDGCTMRWKKVCALKSQWKKLSKGGPFNTYQMGVQYQCNFYNQIPYFFFNWKNCTLYCKWKPPFAQNQFMVHSNFNTILNFGSYQPIFIDSQLPNYGISNETPKYIFTITLETEFVHGIKKKINI